LEVADQMIRRRRPTETQEATERDGVGIAFVPIPGLLSDVDEIPIADLLVREIDVMAWRMIENTRATDIYMSHYQAAPRYYLVAPLLAESEEGADAEMAALVQDAEDLVLALRLLSDGDVIEARYVTPVRRLGAINLRPVPEVARSRFLTTTFGPSRKIVVQDQFSQREWIEDLFSLGGEPFALYAADVPRLEARLALVRSHRIQGDSKLLRSAMRMYTLGRSRLIQPRQRLVALFACLEVLLGGFRRLSATPSLGKLLGITVSGDRSVAADLGAAIERELRPIRNDLAHGRDPFADVELDEVCSMLVGWLRIALNRVLVLESSDLLRREAHLLDDNSQTTEPIRLIRTITRLGLEGNDSALALLYRLDPDS
jgi:hypothetical protein